MSSASGVATANTKQFSGNHFRWPTDRIEKAFRVHVVEPKQYRPPLHADIFNSLLTNLLSPPDSELGYFGASPTRTDRFDLLTFPEAFLPVDQFIQAVIGLRNIASLGCIHVGLRPDTTEHHLFSPSDIIIFAQQLSVLDHVSSDDLETFLGWLSKQNTAARFNIAALLMIDANGQTRICLHPKVVKSKFEISALSEDNMTEADVLTLVTLLPTDKRYLSVTLQPLICADALALQTNRPDGRPLEAVTRFGEVFGDSLPDHIDIVSVATCTPQLEASDANGLKYRTWHGEFQNSFERAAKEDTFARHHFATFVLSNFHSVLADKPGGLSGAFMPVPSRRQNFPAWITVSYWGRPDEGHNNGWSTPEDEGHKWESRGYVTSIRPLLTDGDSRAQRFAFTIERLPRDSSPWQPPPSLTDCRRDVAWADADTSLIEWRREETDG